MAALAILETGRPPGDLYGRFGPYAGFFERALADAGFTGEIVVVPVMDGVLPESADAHDAYIVTGSADSAYERTDWMRDLETFLRRAAKRKPVLGVCFGHQIVAQAFGGRVEKAEHGWRLGLQRYDIAGAPPWFPLAASSLDLLASHQDQVTVPPPGASVIGGNADCPIGMLTLGETVLTVQTHPEFTPELAGALYDSRVDRLPAARYNAAKASLDRTPDNATFWAAAIPFLAG